MTVTARPALTTAAGGSALGAAARNSGQLQRGVSETVCHCGAAAESASAGGPWPRACSISAHVGLFRLTSVIFGPMRAKGSPSRPRTTTASAPRFSTNTAGTVADGTTWIFTPSAGLVDDCWTMV